MIRRVPTAVLALAAVAFAAPASNGQDAKYEPRYEDKVVVAESSGERTYTVEVTSETWEQVEWKSKTGASASRPADTVLSITYADQPTYFDRGLEAFRAGQWDQARSEFRAAQNAVTVGKARPMFDGRCAGYIAECRLKAAEQAGDKQRFKEAADSFKDALEKEPQSPRIDVLHLGLAEALAGSGSQTEALKTLDDLMRQSKTAQRPLWEARARRLRGTLMKAAGETSGAATEFQQLASFAGAAAAGAPAGSAVRDELLALQVEGLVEQGWALFAKAETTKSDTDLNSAKGFFDRLPSLAQNAKAARAASMNGQGAVALLKGDASTALDRFVEVEVTMFAVPNEVTRSLWYKAKAYEALGQAAESRQALSDLKEFYPWSDWANRVR